MRTVQYLLYALAAAGLFGVVASTVTAQTEGGATAGLNTHADSVGQTRSTRRATADSFDGYAFGHVVEATATSVNPLQREVDRSFRVFVDSVQEAERLLDEGRTQEAVQMAAAAIDSVLAVRDTVLDPMWEGQEALAEQIAGVRERLAYAVQAAAENGPVQLDQQTDAMLDAIAQRISSEQDPLRQNRVVAP